MKKEEAVNRNKKFVREFLQEHPCVDCGNDNLVVLDFDHVRGEKLQNVSKMVSTGRSLKTLWSEMEKCEVRCANCHRMVTHLRRQQERTKEGIDYFEY